MDGIRRNDKPMHLVIQSIIQIIFSVILKFHIFYVNIFEVKYIQSLINNFLNFMTTATITFLIGRIIFGGYFAMSGFNHFKNGKMLIKYSASKNVPMPRLAVYFSGLLILLGGVGIILNIYSIISLMLIIAFLLPVSFMIHSYWKISDPMARMTEMTHFLKNMALVGASLMLISFLIA